MKGVAKARELLKARKTIALLALFGAILSGITSKHHPVFVGHDVKEVTVSSRVVRVVIRQDVVPVPLVVSRRPRIGKDEQKPGVG